MNAPLPPDLYGRRAVDRAWHTFYRVTNGYYRVAGLLARGRPLPRAVSSDIRVRLTAATRLADGVLGFDLAGASGEPLPAWRPGCHVDVVLPSGRIRQYSLCGSAADSYRIAVRRVGAGSAELHSVPAGTELTLRGPRNAFPFISAQRYLFVAGGIGITPILPMVHAAAAQGASWSLRYSGRDPAFAAELSGYGDRVTISRCRLPVETVPAGTVVYCCGPPEMISAWRAAAKGPFLSERFSPPVVVNGRAFQVELKRSALTVHVPADRTALAAIRDVLPGIPYSCQQGFCGTCRIGDTLICTDRPATGSMELDL